MSKLFLGVGREIISPEIGCQLFGYEPDIFSAAIEDDLTVTTFCFNHNKKTALLISTTVCTIQTGLSERILTEIETRFGIPRSNCILHATNTHSGPNTAGHIGWGELDSKYCEEIFIPGILSSVNTSVNNTTPVKMGISSAYSYVGVNRREINTDNRVVLGQNPHGYFNPTMTVISFKNAINRNIANIIHYGAHCTARGPGTEIGRDWPGIMTDAVEETSGAITAFFNGTQGDIGPRLPDDHITDDFFRSKELGIVAAHDAVRIYRRIKDFKEIDLSVCTDNILLPLNKRMSLDEALENYEKVKSGTVGLDALKKAHFENVISSYKENYVDKEYMEIKQTLIKLGDILFLSFPFEVFSEIGMRINNATSFSDILSLSSANGSEGYLVTQDQIVRGGYEVEHFKHSHLQSFVDDADWHLIKGSLENIEKLK